MRKVFVSNVMSLDGYFTGADGVFNWFTPDEEFFEYAKNLLHSVDTILFGRKTYQMMATYWPHAPTDEIAEKMNGLAKIVFSKTLPSVEWNNTTLVTADAKEHLSDLKQSPGLNMVIFGSAELASSLLKAGLIDEYRVILAPVILGNGKTMFQDVTERMDLRLVSSQSLASGIVILSYQRA